MDGLAARSFSWITADLAVGGAFGAEEAARLAAEHGVGHVVDMREEACDDAEALTAAGLRFLSLPTVDHHAPTQAQLDAGVAFSAEAQAVGGGLLIHCQHGIGRSATLALCVLVDRGHAPLAALQLAKDARELVSPSPAQFEAWCAWMRRRVPSVTPPHFDAFKAIAYRHLSIEA